MYDQNPEHLANLSVKDLEKRWERLRSLRISLDDALLAAADREKALAAVADSGEEDLRSKYALERN